MKKLMFAAALISAATTFAVDSNIVGYQSNPLRDGYKMMTGTFVPVTGEKVIDLLDFKVGGDVASDDVVIQTLTPSGIALASYVYKYSVRGGWYWSDGKGIISERGAVTFNPGDGLWIRGKENVTLTFAGAVSTDDYTVNLVDGFIASGNMTAVKVDLLDIVPSCETTASDLIYIQTLNSSGVAENSYVFKYSSRGGWYWSDGKNIIKKGDVVFDPGEGLWIHGVNGASLTFKGPEL